MIIGILDGYTLFQEDLDWKALEAFGRVLYQDRTMGLDLSADFFQAEVLITNKYVLNADNLGHFPKLKLILVSATGYNCVDISLCQSKGIAVCNVPNYGTYSVAQHALALLLNYSNQVEKHQVSVAQGDWTQSKDWCYQLTPIMEWKDKTMGIIGMGAIGSCLAGMARSLGMRLVYHHTRDLGLEDARFLSLNDLAEQSDVISLHCPLNAQTQHLVNEGFLSRMRPNAVLINTSRGGLIDGPALAHALNEGQLSAALLDVLLQEPPKAEEPLLGAKNCFITPHMAWISKEARTRIFLTLQEILRHYPQGPLPHRVA